MTAEFDDINSLSTSEFEPSLTPAKKILKKDEAFAQYQQTDDSNTGLVQLNSFRLYLLNAIGRFFQHGHILSDLTIFHENFLITNDSRRGRWAVQPTLVLTFKNFCRLICASSSCWWSWAAEFVKSSLAVTKTRYRFSNYTATELIEDRDERWGTYFVDVMPMWLRAYCCCQIALVAL